MKLINASLLLFLIFVSCSSPKDENQNESTGQKEIEELNVLEKVIVLIKSNNEVLGTEIIAEYFYDPESLINEPERLNIYLFEIDLLKEYIVKSNKTDFVIISGDELINSQFSLYQPIYTRDSICDDCIIYYNASNLEERISVCVRDGKIFSIADTWDNKLDGMVWL